MTDTNNGPDLDALSEKWLRQCGPCDGGLPMGCTHPDEDYRPVMLDLVNEVRRLRGVCEDWGSNYQSWVDATKAAEAERDRLAATVERVRALHAPVGTWKVAEIDETGDVRDVEADTFEEITSRTTNCMSCASYPEWPCETARALDEAQP